LLAPHETCPEYNRRLAPSLPSCRMVACPIITIL
jgi:hypothetical protein